MFSIYSQATLQMNHQPTEVLKPLEQAICTKFIPALTGQPLPGELMRKLLPLPARLGGLGLTNPTLSAKEQRNSSQQISEPLVNRIVNQEHELNDCHLQQQYIKKELKYAQSQRLGRVCVRTAK